ncbi:hypothetical protein [Paragemmobacter straminiformis]|uniref:Uncharacterized protein n=1 Tax=Paragemmobacter straminiformis TaxID=2045119 RepID=A0A842I6K6_9RHOB|nr:hypothetical protein [Gemmobacter straminiformis]MBC2835256.1 hypothetical protein [Gemmobacter straminiformis]
MEPLVDRALIAAQSLTVIFLLYLTPVAITVATIASWRKSVRGAPLIAVSGLLYCLWLLAPVPFSLPEARQISQYVSILGWIWLVLAWGRHVLTEWPVPMWGHWLAGTVLFALPFAILIAMLTP